MAKLWWTRDAESNDGAYVLTLKKPRWIADPGLWRCDGQWLEVSGVVAKAFGLPALGYGERVRIEATFKVEPKP